MDYGHAETDKKLKAVEKKIHKEYKKAAKEVEKKAKDYFAHVKINTDKMKALRDAGKITAEEYSEWTLKQFAIINKWGDMEDHLTKVYLQADKVAADIIQDHRFDVYALNYNYGTYEIEKGLHLNTNFALYDKSTVARLAKDNPKLLPPIGKKTSEKIRQGKLKKWTGRQIRSVMMQGILQGESIDKIAKRLAKTVSEKSSYSHIRAARTMTTSAENAGRLDSYKRAEEMGVYVTKTWLAVHDERTRESHVMYDGMSIGIDEEFAPGLKFPGDPDADPAEVYNCRCTLIAVPMAANNELLLDLTDEGLWKDKWDIDYDAWKSGHSIFSEQEQQEQNVPKPSKAVEPPKATAEPVYDELIDNAKGFSASYHTEHNFNRDVWDNTFTDAERHSVREYTSSSYGRMNDILRGVKSDDRYTHALIEGCTSALEKTKIADDTMLYRGMGRMKHLASSMGIDEIAAREAIADGSIVGQRFVEKGFCSTGIDKYAGWKKEVNLEIVAPKGTKGMYVDPISEFQGEQELLLQRGTTFEIYSAKEVERPNGNTVYTLKVKVVDQKLYDY